MTGNKTVSRVLSNAPVALFILYAIVPGCTLLGWATGYRYALVSGRGYCVVLAVLSVMLTAGGLPRDDPPGHNKGRS